MRYQTACHSMIIVNQLILNQLLIKLRLKVTGVGMKPLQIE
jgi:hypothetical protein